MSHSRSILYALYYIGPRPWSGWAISTCALVWDQDGIIILQCHSPDTCTPNHKLIVRTVGMLSPRTGFEAKKLALASPSASCDLASWSRLYNVFSLFLVLLQLATATVKSVIMKTKDGNVVNEARSGQGREKKFGKPCPLSSHTGVTTWH